MPGSVNPDNFWMGPGDPPPEWYITGQAPANPITPVVQLIVRVLETSEYLLPKDALSYQHAAVAICRALSVTHVGFGTWTLDAPDPD